MKTTQTPQFLDYLREHPATKDLADGLAQVLALRGRSDLIPFRDGDSDSRRLAS
ncbi:MAG TPA: hypothetical protein VL119_11915 [Acidimicrobiia bacterium]|nr:hypothetical protein [Acidimicrobiia bacterium]